MYEYSIKISHIGVIIYLEEVRTKAPELKEFSQLIFRVNGNGAEKVQE